ncbi:MAG: hypothetical protein CVV25_14255 [Ignavibacteriae bacterium HGW-Ignavibacteriae-4]|jgi:site-specific recombinase XerD|nr:MAG: hypothetical protein CVV25_14255 [Ignavibacteriae bacterium HGW-Ignavibacteriae-4]
MNNPLMHENDILIAEDNLGSFFESLIKMHENTNIFYILKKLVSLTKKVLEEKTNREFVDIPVSEFLDQDIISHICSLLPNNKARGNYKVWFKKIIRAAFSAKEEVLKLNPKYCLLINIVTYFDYNPPEVKTKRIQADPIKDHPLVGDLINYLYEKNLRSQHHSKYGVRDFLKWLCSNVSPFTCIKPQEVDFKKINKSHLKIYKSFLEMQVIKQDIGIRHAVTTFNAVKRMFAFLKEKNHVMINPAKDLIIHEKVHVKKPVLITLKQMELYLEAVYLHSVNPLMDVALFSLYTCTGVRSISALGTKIKDFDPVNHILKVTLKGGDEHIQPLPSVVVIQIERYLQTRYFVSEVNYDEEPLWVNVKNRPVDRQCVIRKFHKYKRIAGINESIGAVHFLRHLFYSELINDGFKVEDIIGCTGVKSLHEVEPYIHCRRKDMFDKMLNNFNVIGLSKVVKSNEGP